MDVHDIVVYIHILIYNALSRLLSMNETLQTKHKHQSEQELGQLMNYTMAHLLNEYHY